MRALQELTQLFFNQRNRSRFLFNYSPPASLSPALTRTLEGSELLHGQVHQVFDLTRTLLADGALPVLTRGCKLFAQRCSRFLSRPEALIAQGWALHHSMRSFKVHDQVSEVSTAADSAVCDDWVLILLQSVGDAAMFAPEHGAANGGLYEANSGSLPSCGRTRDLFPLSPLFDLVLVDSASVGTRFRSGLCQQHALPLHGHSQ